MAIDLHVANITLHFFLPQVKRRETRMPPNFIQVCLISIFMTFVYFIVKFNFRFYSTKVGLQKFEIVFNPDCIYNLQYG